ncbi:MAG: type I DNA topoisomerase [Actinomycetota bacterium]|nr:type I DNA topoisomerase [Acidimicrobiales bacterium]MEC7899009.1 type I DNA topoisomerase [Actinomycetota bacterium]
MNKVDVVTALVIVESPAKAKTIEKYLGDGYIVDSSVGHIRDLVSPKDVPEDKKERFGKLGIDVYNGFEPLYAVSPNSKKQVAQLKKALKKVDELYLATDEDREGEAIAWHLLEVLKPSVPVKRMVFNEITKEAITEALENTRDLSNDLVEAQEARRILDRIYGFELSNVTRTKVGGGASAGRVQSPATRLVIERERERMQYVTAGYWGLKINAVTEGNETFSARLLEIDGLRVATGKDFNEKGNWDSDLVRVLDESSANDLSSSLNQKDLQVVSVEPKPYRRRPASPFTTSTFQQEAGRKLRFSASRAMGIAQSLYQNGHITYMRTDSTTLSDTAISASRKAIEISFGSDYLPSEPRLYKNKTRNAQEAHEAIRPAGETFRKPDELSKELSKDEYLIYEMIWQRTIASQMTDAIGETVSVKLEGSVKSDKSDKENFLVFSLSGTVISHQGFRQVYIEDSDDNESDDSSSDEDQVLPEVQVGQSVSVTDSVPESHETKPPARYTEASLVKRLEEEGIGRPSTYAAILGRIIQREYAWKKGTALIPTVKGFAVTQLLEAHFPKLVDYKFTAEMEVALDDISNGMWEKTAYLQAFYFDGLDGDIGLHTKVVEREDEIDPRAVCGVSLGETPEGHPVYARYARSPYVEYREDTAGVPEDLPLDQLTVEKALEYINAPPDRELGTDPETGLPVVAKQGRFGPYVSLGRFPQWPKASSREGKLFRLPHHLKVMKVAIAYLKMTVSPDDDSVLRVINSPKRGIGKGSLDKAKTYAESNGVSLFEALEQTEKLELKGAVLKSVQSFTDFSRSFSALGSLAPADLLNQIFEDSGYKKEILAAKNSESQLKVFEDFVEVLKEFENIDQVIAEIDRFEEIKQQPKPKTSSLFDTMTLERVTFEDALQLLSLPRTVGLDPSDGQEITVQNGPYGPYLKKGSDTRNIATEEELLTISLEQCLDLLAQPKKFGRRAAKPPLKELGIDPVSEKPILLKDGQWGPYVTDGSTNASLQLGDSVEEITDERAVELLAERRAKV